VSQSQGERESKQHAEILRFLAAIHEPGDVVELRCLGFLVRGDFRATGSGYYSDFEALARDTVRASSRSKGAYVTLNRIDPALLARRANVFDVVNRGEPLTSDPEVRLRRWVFIDCDAVRLSGIPSSDPEHGAALSKAREIREALAAESWPAPMLVDTGNGAALYFRVDLRPDDENLVKHVLEGLAGRFDCAEVKIDCSVFNPARIVRLPGTLNAKGSHTDERPHRYCRIVDLPETLEPVPEALLHDCALKTGEKLRGERRGVGFDLALWITKYLPDAEGPTAWNGGGEKWVLPVCPWNPQHTNRSAFVLRMASGAVSAGCHHNGCADRDWHSLREAVEPGWREARERRAEAGKLAPLEPASSEDSFREPPRPYQPFPIHALPQPLSSFTSQGARAIGCDPAYLALPALAAAASGIGNSRRIFLKRKWREPPILWTAIVGESGTQKSPALSLVLEPIHAWQAERLRDHERALKEYEIEKEKYEKALAKWKKVKDGEDPPERPEPPAADRILVKQTTIEALAAILVTAPRGVLVGRDELSGWLGSFDQYHGGRADSSYWLEAHRGEPWIIDRKTGPQRVIHIPSAAVSITGGIQPKVLQSALLEGQHYQDGLAPRLLLATPPQRPKRWVDADVDPATEMAFQGMLGRLRTLEMEGDEETGYRPIDLSLEPEARKRLRRARGDYAHNRH
jgi:hypothetical protein